ncbi:protein crumbs homolog 1-like [Limanda limanda]|uniref:protein crumbs homolog 1-like n=1 Tax=Limanda limanda TaxID=27771 RepID=UPI0029C92EE8|nr:protein crumbs homolog 1-like [Limanda limanda]
MLRYSVHVWTLCLLYAGTSSSEDANRCELQPCQNSGMCESHYGGFRCLCSKQSQNGRLYGGETCTIALSGCDDHQCENGGICSPLLVNDQHTYTCICLPGFTGSKCETPTAFSFESRGYMYIETQHYDPEAPVNITFSFRTDRAVGTLLQRRVDDLLFSVELMDGHLCLLSQSGLGSSTLVQELPEYLSDNKWHTAEASLGDVVSLLRLLCTEGDCTRHSSEEDQLFDGSSGFLEPGTVNRSLFIGAAVGSRGLDRAVANYPPAFLGCFRDVLVDSHLVLPVVVPEDSDAQANVTVGCSDKDKCDSSPCQNRGRCVSQGWRSYMCECLRPYEGKNCAEEYITARFGNEDAESYAVFSLDDDPGDPITISMFIRTRQSSGLLLVLANSTSQYLRLWLEEGRVKAQVNNFETLVGPRAVSDGHFHLVTVKLEGTAASLFQSAQDQASMPIRHIHAHSGDLVFIGGLPDSRASASFGGYFKGCVQDLRINRKRLQFRPIETAVESYHLEKLVNVAQGCSSDDACAVKPCLNGGMCYSLWDDFICNCPPNTAGQRCEEVKWCELSPCPTGAVCLSHSQGFECLANVTFRADSTVLQFQSNGKIRRSLTSVFLSLRTRQSAATILRAQRGSDHLIVSLQDSHLVMEIKAGDDQVTVQSQGAISDGAWRTVELSKTLPTSRWIMEVDGSQKQPSMSQTAAGNLDFLREGADIFLGGLVGLDAGVNFSGCVGSVEIGGLLLPFYLDTALNLPRPQEEQFVRVKVNADPQLGCWGASVCASSPCQNQGVCEDVFDLHHCTCPSEWTGPLCEQSTDNCISGPCIHGHCTNSPGGFECVCELGYSGEQCEFEVDMCENNNCSKGATCLKGFQSYACLCPQNRTGLYCDSSVPEIPWYIETYPLPQLPTSTCMGSRWKYSCYNGGNCSEVENTCYCLPGFTGQWCQKDVDECASYPCMNGGFCVNYMNSFECVCDMNYSGIHCQMDVSDFYLYLFLGVWQNLFQLVSYLLIRMDDEPEVEWIFHFNE